MLIRTVQEGLNLMGIFAEDMKDTKYCKHNAFLV